MYVILHSWKCTREKLQTSSNVIVCVCEEREREREREREEREERDERRREREREWERERERGERERERERGEREEERERWKESSINQCSDAVLQIRTVAGDLCNVHTGIISDKSDIVWVSTHREREWMVMSQCGWCQTVIDRATVPENGNGCIRLTCTYYHQMLMQKTYWKTWSILHFHNLNVFCRHHAERCTSSPNKLFSYTSTGPLSKK